MNRDSENLLAQLMATPVGRRWILKAGLGSAAALAAAAMSRSAAASQSPSASAVSQPTPTANRTLHFALTPAVSGGIANLELVANGARTPLVAHTADSRAALQKQGGIFAAADLNALSHYVHDVPLRARHDVPSRRSQKGPVKWEQMQRLTERWIPRTHIVHPSSSVSLGVMMQGKSPVR